MFASTMLNERAAIKKHGAEHYNFMIETESKAVQTGWKGHVQKMDTSKVESPDGSAVKVYGAAIDAGFGI
jgi:hypothetical protein